MTDTERLLLLETARRLSWLCDTIEADRLNRLIAEVELEAARDRTEQSK